MGHRVSSYAIWSIALLCGFDFSLQATAAPSETVLYSFTGGNDGGRPLAGLTKAGDVLYGTTGSYGTGGRGTIFSITEDGVFTILYSFTGDSDAGIVAAPLLYADGVLYGTSEVGGSYGPGTFFKLTLDGQETILHSFRGDDGSYPMSAPVQLNGKFYGTTYSGSSSTYGTIFSVTKSGVEKVLHTFNGANGEAPVTGLTVMNGVLYGTASNGGSYAPASCAGTAYSMTADGTFKLLHSFGGQNDGCDPWGTLLPVDGTLYGTTQGDSKGNQPGKGVLYSLTPNGVEAVIDYFGGREGDAIGNLVAKGQFLYGTAQEGGGHGTGRGGAGSVFQAAMSAGHKARAYYGFGRTTADGMTPSPGLLRVGNSFYGVTNYGGKYNQGVIFKITQ